MDLVNKIKKYNIWLILPSLSVEDLEKIITYAADKYYNTQTSVIDDATYDILVDTLKERKPNSNVLKNIGSPIKGNKVKLPYWLGSMEKIKTNAKLINKWVDKYPGPYVLSDKLDGVSCLLTIVQNEIKLYTRGDGEYGKNITFLADYINLSVDHLLTLNKDVAVRGELIISKKNFKKYEKTMSNARSMIIGIVNTKKNSLNTDHANDVDFVSYEIISPSMKPSKQMYQMKKWGLNVVYYDIFEDIDLDILDNLFDKRKKKSKYEIDGIIVSNDKKYPHINEGNPPYSFAYKGVTETADTKVIDIIWEPSKDGVIVPTIHYDKIRLSQADLEYTAGFNAKYIEDNKLGPGAVIKMIRSGDVIPYIISVVKPAKKAALPTDYEYHWDKNHVNIILDNPDDNADVVIKRLEKFVKTIGVDNMSQGIITKLVNAGYDTIKKLIKITVDDMLEIDGFQETLANKLYNNLQSALDKMNVLKLMVGSNIFGRGFGERRLKMILDVYPDIVDEYSKKYYDAWSSLLMDIEGFDTITVDLFLNALPKFQKFYDKISKIVDVQPYQIKKKAKGNFNEMKIVFTGFRDNDLKEFIENNGGKVTTTVSGNTTLVIYAEGGETSSKYLKAVKLGIPTMTKTEFIEKRSLKNLIK